MTIFLISSPCNKSPTFVFLIYQFPLILSTTPSYFIVFPPGSLVRHILCFTTMVHFISLISHIYCRDPSTQFPFIPSYLWSSIRLRSQPSSFQSLYHSSWLSHQCLFHLSSPVWWRYTTLHILCSYKYLVCHKQPSVHYHSHLILDVF